MKLNSYTLTLAVSLQPAIACLQHVAGEYRTRHPRDIAMRKRAPSPLAKVAIENVRVYNGTAMTDPQTIIIDGDKIAYNATNVTQTIDATGKYLIPGLIESHAHPSDMDALEDMSSYGVTTVFSMACHNYTECALMRENNTGLTDFHTAGWSAVGNGSSHAKNSIPTQLFYPDQNVDDWVEWVFGNGSDYLKITVETNGPSFDAQVAMVKKTHAMGYMTMSHSGDLVSYRQAIASGTDAPQHVPIDGNLTAHDVEKMLQQGQFATPTMEIYRNAFFINPTIGSYLMGSSSSLDNYTYATIQENVRTLRKAGVPILAGTDATGSFSSNATYAFGVTLHRELQNLVEVGFSPVEALNAATQLPAKYHQVPDRGYISIGKRADLILLNSNPLENITNTLDMARVWIGGREYKDVVGAAATNN